MNEHLTAAGWVTIPVTNEHDGINGAVRRLHQAGYYATVVGGIGDTAILYGPRSELLTTRVPYVALVGDTIRVTDRSPRHDNQHQN